MVTELVLVKDRTKNVEFVNSDSFASCIDSIIKISFISNLDSSRVSGNINKG